MVNTSFASADTEGKPPYRTERTAGIEAADGSAQFNDFWVKNRELFKALAAATAATIERDTNVLMNAARNWGADNDALSHLLDRAKGADSGTEGGVGE